MKNGGKNKSVALIILYLVSHIHTRGAHSGAQVSMHDQNKTIHWVNKFRLLIFAST